MAPLADLYDTDPNPAIANRAKVQLAYLDYVALGQLTSAQINVMQALAAGCPRMEGHAVYTARNVLAALNLAATYQPTCAEPKSQSTGEGPDFVVNQLRIYPSPTSGRFTLDISAIPTRPTYTLQIWSTTGRLVLTRTLSGKRGSQEIELSTESGLYYLTLFDLDTGDQYHQKIVVQ
jgi:hypothetical protein